MIVQKNEAQAVVELLKELFKTHGFETEEHEGWVIPEGSDYAMKGYWYAEATENTGQLSIELFINSEMVMVESFAGIGDTAVERLKQAFASFVHHSFPTFLQAIWGKKSDKVSKEIWTIGTECYEAYIGIQGIINYDQSKELIVPESYLSKIKEKILNEKLENEFHWFGLFFANINGLDTYAEVSKDNVKWEEAGKIITSLAWKRSNSYYAVRQFLVLKKV